MRLNKHIDATTGKLIPNILVYMMPILMNSLIQTIYNSVDKIVLGNMASSVALAAVGASSYTYSFLINLFVGCSAGVRVILARYIGERNAAKIKSTVDTSLILSVGFGVVAAVIGFFAIPWLMSATKCPDECYNEAVLYLRIYISAAPIVLLANFSTAILNTAGDTRRTMLIGIGSGFGKVALNFLMCLILPNKIVAVSMATVMAASLTMCLNLYYLKKGVGQVQLQLHPKKLDWNTHICGKVLGQGLPIGLANCLAPLTDMMLQTQTNLLGVAAMAGNSAGSAIDHIGLSVLGALPVTCGVFVGQNLGAQKHDRVKKVFWYCLGMEVVLGVVITAISFLIRGPILRVIVTDDPEALRLAFVKLDRMLPWITCYGLAALFEQYVRTLGYAKSSSICTLIAYMGLRLVFVWCIYPNFGTFDVLMMHYSVAYISNSLGQGAIAAVAYLRHKKGKYKKL